MPDGHVIAVSWTGFAPGDHTLEFPLEAAHAADAAQLYAAARRFECPPQNIVYADTQGQIGFVAAGRLPVRGPDNDLRGRVPAPGWLDRYDWQGFVPFDELPQRSGASSGAIVTANQKITEPDYRHWVGGDWAPPYRAQRIEALLAATPKHTLQSFMHIQADVQSGSAVVLLPLLTGLATPRDDAARAWLERLRRWDLAMRADAAEPLVFAAWVRELGSLLYADELGAAFEDAWNERPVFLGNVLADRDGQSRWCDDVSTDARESCSEIVSRALESALAYLGRQYGDEASDWSWGRAHPAHSSHVLGTLPIIGRWFEIDLPSPGDNQSVNVGGYDLADDSAPFAAITGPGLRAIYDLADPEASLFISSTGQSGHFLSPHYADASEPWVRVAYVPMHTERARVEAGNLGVLRLTPRAAGRE
jgi:penicillin amidase